MPERNRSRQLLESGSIRFKSNGNVLASGNRTSFSQNTTDITGKGDNMPFSSSMRLQEGGIMTGSTSSYNYLNYPALFTISDPRSYNHGVLPTLNTATLASSLLARTTPNRASSQIDVSLWELREIPKLIKDSWEIANEEFLGKYTVKAFRALKLTAKLNLMVRFGIAPLISDLDKLLQFQALVNQRVREIQRLRTRGLRRTVDLRSDSVITETSYTVQSVAVSIVRPVTKLTKRQITGHIRWKATDNFVESDEQVRKVATGVVYGAKLDFVSAWHAMPWTWLIDYFTNLGDFINISRNSIPAIHDTPRIMTHTTTETSFAGGTFGSAGVISPYTAKYETKDRSLVPASVSARIGFLTGAQTSILGSLSILRGL
jgi:hypothetical protein